MRTTVVNVRDCPVGWEGSADYAYVGRPGRGHSGKYGNPHHVGHCFPCRRWHDRAEAVRLHAGEARVRYAQDPAYRQRVERLRGKFLVCFCKRAGVEVACHADAYVELLEGVSR